MSSLNKKFWWSGSVVLVVAACGLAQAEFLDLKPLIAKVRAVGPKGAGHREATVAWQALVKADAAQLPEILASLDDSGPLAENWLRAAVEAVAERHVKNGGSLPMASLEKFLADSRHSPRGRRLAYELIAGVDQTAEPRLIPGLLNDPSLELRRDAVALALKQAEASAIPPADKSTTVAAYRKAFHAARDLDQVKIAVEKLRGLGETVDVQSHFGFVTRWKVAAPFDNGGAKGFDVAYPPEKEVDLKDFCDGKGGKIIGWVDVATTDDYGNVDLNKSYDTYQRDADGKPLPKKIEPQYKGSVAYAFAEIIADKEQDVELRLGSTNANKIWLNGELLTANHIYHTGREVDQYVGRGRMKKGRNQILLKIAQNEQAEEWAQDWQFQLRVCDRIGTAILSQDRPSAQTAAAN